MNNSDLAAIAVLFVLALAGFAVLLEWFSGLPDFTPLLVGILVLVGAVVLVIQRARA